MPYCIGVHNSYLNDQLKVQSNRLKLLKDGNWEVNLTDSQYGSLGSIVGVIYYRHPTMLDCGIFRTGFPHNGGQHTLFIRGSKDIILSFLTAVISKFKAYQDIRYQTGLTELSNIRDYLLVQ